MNNDSSRRAELIAKIIIAVFIGSLLLGGLVPMLIALGILKVDPATIHAPHWVLFAFGAVFFVAGLYLLQLVLSKREDKRWTHLAVSLFYTGIALAGGWVAFGSGAREFIGEEQTVFLSERGPMSESTGRAMFSVGCLITSVLAIRAWSKFFKSLRTT